MAFQLEVRGPWPGNLASATCKKPQGAHFARGLHLSACLLRNDMETGTGSIFYGAVADIFISCYVLCFFVVLPGGEYSNTSEPGRFLPARLQKQLEAAECKDCAAVSW